MILIRTEERSKGSLMQRMEMLGKKLNVCRFMNELTGDIELCQCVRKDTWEQPVEEDEE